MEPLPCNYKNKTAFFRRYNINVGRRSPRIFLFHTSLQEEQVDETDFSGGKYLTYDLKRKKKKKSQCSTVSTAY